MPVGGSEPTVNTTGGGRGGCQWVVVNQQSTRLSHELYKITKVGLVH